MKAIFPHPVCPQTIAEWAFLGRSCLIDGGDEPAIFNIKLGVHDDVEIDVHSAGRFCCLSQLDGPSFAGILYVAAVMKPVIIGCREVEPQGVFACQKFSQGNMCQGQVFRHHCRIWVTLTAG